MAPSRLATAFALSAALHGLLIYGPGFSPAPPGRPMHGYLNVRLTSLPSPLPPGAVAARPSVIVDAPERPVVEPVLMPAVSRDVPDAPDAPEIVPEVPEGRVDAEPSPAAAEPAVTEADTGRPIGFGDPVHYPAKDLDVYPRLRVQAKPVYPDAALAARISGSVTLSVLIDEGGRVTEAAVVGAQPEGVFEVSAVTMVSASMFTPAIKDGRAVRSRLLFAVEFDPARHAGP